jgi:hypothetical protein
MRFHMQDAHIKERASREQARARSAGEIRHI